MQGEAAHTVTATRRSAPRPPVERPAQAPPLVAVDLAAGLVLLVSAISLDGEALRLAAGVAALVSLAARGWLGGATGALLGLLPLGVLVPGLLDTNALPVAAALTGLATVPHALGVAAVSLVPGVAAGRRHDLTPALLANALAGGLGIVIAIGAAGVVDVGDPRLTPLMPYAAAAGALVALAEVLAHHHRGAGFPQTPLSLLLAATAVLGMLLVLGSADPGSLTARSVDGSVTATLLATVVGAAGLLTATALASPRPLAVPHEEAAGGPRLVGWIVAGLAVVAVVPRLVVAARDLWLDEAATVAATDGSFGTMVDAVRTSEAHPPLLDSLVWASQHLFGDGVLAVRLPALVAGVLLVPAVYVTGARLYDRRVGVVAAVVAAFGPGALWLSAIARPATLAALLATVALFLLLRALEDDRSADWVLFGLACAALVWSHQFAVLHAAVLVVAAALRSGPRRGWVVSAAMTAGAVAALVAFRGGIGPPDLLPPLEYATAGAPGAGRSVLGLAGTAVTAVVGFHPADVTSRLLALWPLGMLAIFFLAVRSWSWRSALLATLVATPFAALLVAQLVGAPRNPPFALEWVATAVPMLALAVGRVVGLSGSWPRLRIAAGALALVLAIAAVDQITRVTPSGRFDVAAAIEPAGDDAVVLYAPAAVGDLVRHEAGDATVRPVDQAGDLDLAAAPEVVVVGAFGFSRQDPGVQEATLALVDELAASRELVAEEIRGETKVWTFA